LQFYINPSRWGFKQILVSYGFLWLFFPIETQTNCQSSPSARYGGFAPHSLGRSDCSGTPVDPDFCQAGMPMDASSPGVALMISYDFMVELHVPFQNAILVASSYSDIPS